MKCEKRKHFVSFISNSFNEFETGARSVIHLDTQGREIQSNECCGGCHFIAEMKISQHGCYSRASGYHWRILAIATHSICARARPCRRCQSMEYSAYRITRDVAGSTFALQITFERKISSIKFIQITVIFAQSQSKSCAAVCAPRPLPVMLFG